MRLEEIAYNSIATVPDLEACIREWRTQGAWETATNQPGNYSNTRLELGVTLASLTELAGCIDKYKPINAKFKLERDLVSHLKDYCEVLLSIGRTLDELISMKIEHRLMIRVDEALNNGYNNKVDELSKNWNRLKEAGATIRLLLQAFILDRDGTPIIKDGDVIYFLGIELNRSDYPNVYRHAIADPKGIGRKLNKLAERLDLELNLGRAIDRLEDELDLLNPFKV